jgi:hypothetical protein
MSLAAARAFVRIDVRGVEPVIDTLENVAGILAAGTTLEAIMRRAARPIVNTYRAAAARHDATGNLARSTTSKVRTYRPGVTVAIAGPRHTGNQGATGEVASGNHSWLVEFGSNGRRRPQSRGKRKTYVNVHQMINRRMTKVAKLEDSDDFARRGRGYYFLMSSWREPTRQARAGRGYTHDFLPDAGDGPRPFTLHPGEDYGAMPAYHLMENTINARRTQVQGIIRNGLIDAINAAVSGAL